MARGITTDLIDGVKEMVSELCAGWARALPDLVHADVRLEVAESKVASVENGEPKFANDDYACAFGVRVLAGRRMVGAGYLGGTLGAADLPRLREILRDALGPGAPPGRRQRRGQGRRRARSFRPGIEPRRHAPGPVRVARETVPAVYRVDPRTMPLETMVRTATELGREIRALDPRLTYSHLATSPSSRASCSAPPRGPSSTRPSR